MPTHIKASTQEHLDIEDITQNLVLLKDGSAAIVLRVGAVNFNLLSDEEQDSIIFSYAGLLNSLTFPTQILIRSQQKDITTYIRLLQTQQQKQANPVIRTRLAQYTTFVEKLVKERRVLDKKCYVVIPFFRTELGLSAINPVTGKAPQKLPYDKTYILGKAKGALEPKRDHLLRQFGRLGLIARELNTQELIEFFYSVYNPQLSATAVKDLQATFTPMVSG